MFDQEIRTALAREHIAQLHEEMEKVGSPAGRARRATRAWLARFGSRPAPARQSPCREVNSRA